MQRNNTVKMTPVRIELIKRLQKLITSLKELDIEQLKAFIQRYGK